MESNQHRHFDASSSGRFLTRTLMKFGFLTVTYAGMFYNGPALTIVEQIRKARQLGFDGLSIETKRPIASPLDLTQQHRQEIRAAAQAEGIEICAVESMSNF